MSNRWKDAGFTQRRPKEPGVYFMRTDGHRPMNPPRRLRENWEIVELRYSAGGWGNESDNREDAAHWRVNTLGGLDMAWRAGMWLKGPITPFDKSSEATAHSVAQT
jgi:hypothetical protein